MQVSSLNDAHRLPPLVPELRTSFVQSLKDALCAATDSSCPCDVHRALTAAAAAWYMLARMQPSHPDHVIFSLRLADIPGMSMIAQQGWACG